MNIKHIAAVAMFAMPFIGCTTVETTMTTSGTLSPVLMGAQNNRGQVQQEFIAIAQHLIAETENTTDEHQDPPSKFDRTIDARNLNQNDYVVCDEIRYFTSYSFMVSAQEDESRITAECSVVRP